MQPKRSPSAPDARLQADAEILSAAVAELVRVYQFRDRDRICCHDISVTQGNALEMLARRGPMRAQALAECLRLDKSTTTRVVDALERKGYVQRASDPVDARALSLRITRAGRTLQARIERELVAQHANLLADFDPSMRAAAADVVRRLARAAEARFVGGSCAPGECSTEDA
jgi:DNA-binding MarR family transcriptional regulator